MIFETSRDQQRSQPQPTQLEDFQIGMDLSPSKTKTVTRGDVDLFVMLSGDDNIIHKDVQSARIVIPDAPDVIVPGLLVISIVSGLLSDSRRDLSKPVLFEEIREWRFLRPVYPGDTIAVQMSVDNIEQPGRRSGGWGTVVMGLTVVNQKNKRIATGLWHLRVKSAG